MLGNRTSAFACSSNLANVGGESSGKIAMREPVRCALKCVRKSLRNLEPTVVRVYGPMLIRRHTPGGSTRWLNVALLMQSGSPTPRNVTVRTAQTTRFLLSRRIVLLSMGYELRLVAP